MTARRLHDLNRSGWFMVLCFIPVINIFMWLYLIFASGTQGKNSYGTQRITAVWEKILAWVIILATILLIIIFSTVFFYLVDIQETYTPTEILQQTTDYF